MLLEAFVLIGPRISMLLMTLSPAFGALLAWIFLGEQPSGLQIAGIAITIAGIAIVVSKRPASQESRPKGYFGGILLAFAAAVGQSAAFLLSKIAMTGEYSAFSANLIRISAATVCLAILALLRGTFFAHVRNLADKKAALLTITATMIGPVTGVALALYTINHTLVGIGTTLISLPPIFLIPISRLVFGERIGPRAIIGSLISVAGVVLMVLPDSH